MNEKNTEANELKRSFLNSLPDEKLLERFGIANGNLALAKIGQACGETEDYQKEADLIKSILKERLKK